MPCAQLDWKRMAHQVFISYSYQDKLVADAACARLEARGVRCWIAPRDVNPGVNYGEELSSAIHGARILVLIFLPECESF